MTDSEHKPNIVTDIPRLPPRPPEMHKGQAGHVAIIAGSRGMSGAAVLSGLGALRGGAGLVRVCTPESVQPIVAAGEPCLMTVLLPETREGLLDGLEALDQTWAHALAVGPGLGQSPRLQGLLWKLVESADVPLVIDADGLNNLAGEASSSDETRRRWRGLPDRPTIITPHPGEMARLRKSCGLPELKGNDDQTRLRIAHEFASYADIVVVLKGHRTVVCTRDEAYVNTTGNSGMATGGMGDVLTGLIAALLAQGLSAFDAARLGVYCHAAAADLLARQIGPFGYLAREVADALPAVLEQAARSPIGFK